MPIYEYECSTCGTHFDRRQSFGDSSAPHCPSGHGDVRRVYSAPGIVFKGSGWYVTDTRSKSSSSSDS